VSWCRRVVVAGLVLGAWALAGVETAAAGSHPRLVSPPRALGRLIPTDAVALLYLRSADEADACWRELLQAGGSHDSLGPNVLAWATRGTGVQPARVHRRRPLALAFSLGGLGQPLQMTAILPLADRRGFATETKQIAPAMTVVVQGDYAGISPLPGYAAGHATPAFATKLLDSPVTARLRPHTVAPLARFLTAAAMGRLLADKCPAPGPGRTALSDSAAAWCARMQAAQAALREVCDAMDAVETVDLGLQAKRGVATLSYTIVPLAGHRGILPTGVQARTALDGARCLPRDFPAVAVVALDFARLADFTSPLATVLNASVGDRLPVPWREPVRAVQHLGFELQRAMTGGSLMAMDFGPQGVAWVRIFTMENAEQVATGHRDELLRVLATVPGLQVAGDPPASLDGTPVSTYRVRFDLTQRPTGADSAASAPASAEVERMTRQLLGGDEAVFRIAAVHDKLIAVGAPEPVLLQEILAAAQRSPAPVPGWLQPVLASPPDTLCWYAHADLRTVLQPVVAIAGQDTVAAHRAAVRAALQDAPPAPITLRGTVGRGIYRGELQVDVAGMRAVAAALRPLAPMHAKHDAPGRSPDREP
jgi:hypothetical protein